MANNMYDKSLTAESISSNLASNEAARSGFFMLVVSDLDNLVRPDYSGEEITDAVRIKNAAEILKLHVVKCEFTDFTVDTLEYRRGNDIVRFAGLPKWDAGTFVVDDIVGLDTKSILTAWKYKVYNPHTHKGGRMVDYKKTATLVEYTQDYEEIRRWTLEGVFITGLDNPTYDKENGDDKRQITATFSYDRAIMDLPY